MVEAASPGKMANKVGSIKHVRLRHSYGYLKAEATPEASTI